MKRVVDIWNYHIISWPMIGVWTEVTPASRSDSSVFAKWSMRSIWFRIILYAELHSHTNARSNMEIWFKSLFRSTSGGADLLKDADRPWRPLVGFASKLTSWGVSAKFKVTILCSLAKWALKTREVTLQIKRSEPCSSVRWRNYLAFTP
jgi:hypothetical protein